MGVTDVNDKDENDSHRTLYLLVRKDPIRRTLGDYVDARQGDSDSDDAYSYGQSLDDDDNSDVGDGDNDMKDRESGARPKRRGLIGGRGRKRFYSSETTRRKNEGEESGGGRSRSPRNETNEDNKPELPVYSHCAVQKSPNPSPKHYRIE